MAGTFWDALNQGLTGFSLPMAMKKTMADEETAKNIGLLTGKLGLESYMNSGDPAALEMARTNLEKVSPGIGLDLSGIKPSLKVQEEIRAAGAKQKILDELAGMSQGTTLTVNNPLTGDVDRLDQDWNKPDALKFATPETSQVTIPGRQPTLQDVLNVSLKHDPTGTATLKMGMQQATLESALEKLKWMKDVQGGHDQTRLLAALIASQGRADRDANKALPTSATMGIEKLVDEAFLADKRTGPLQDKLNKARITDSGAKLSSVLGPDQLVARQQLVEIASELMQQKKAHNVASAVRMAIEEYANPGKYTGGGGSTGNSDVMSIIDSAATSNGLDTALLRSLVKSESNFDPNAISPKGARGLTQLMPGTARDLGVKDPNDPLSNANGGARYLKQMLTKYGGDLETALIAYNWGPGNVDKYGIERAPAVSRNYARGIMARMGRGSNDAGAGSGGYKWENNRLVAY